MFSFFTGKCTKCDEKSKHILDQAKFINEQKRKFSESQIALDTAKKDIIDLEQAILTKDSRIDELVYELVVKSRELIALKDAAEAKTTKAKKPSAPKKAKK